VVTGDRSCHAVGTRSKKQHWGWMSPGSVARPRVVDDFWQARQIMRGTCTVVLVGHDNPLYCVEPSAKDNPRHFDNRPRGALKKLLAGVLEVLRSMKDPFSQPGMR
jgi:hypothetical protein